MVKAFLSVPGKRILAQASAIAEAKRILAETEPKDSGAYGWSVNPYLLTLPARMALAEALENFVSW